jgi:polyhydroxybutyrate depolymerase
MPFVSDIIDEMRERLKIDRVYATGYSMGGMFSFRLGCEMRDQIDGVASVASTFPEYLFNACQGAPPVPVIVIHGTDDSVVPWRGVRGGYFSAANTVAYWSLHNRCDTYVGITMDEDVDPDDNTRIVREAFTDCEDDADVMLYGVFYGGHTWPGGPFRVGIDLGPTSGDIQASRVIWTFFNS